MSAVTGTAVIVIAIVDLVVVVIRRLVLIVAIRASAGEAHKLWAD